MSVDALSRPWLNFEIGVAWGMKTRIMIFCHKGLKPSALPRPHSSLQVVDINDLKHDEKLGAIGRAISTALGLQLPTEIPASGAAEPMAAESFGSVYRTWSLRPAAHIGETVQARFLVGAVSSSWPDLAAAAGFKPGEALHVRLFTGPTPEGRYVAALVGGETASFFERVVRDTVTIEATLRLAASYEKEGAPTTPIIVVEGYDVCM